MGFVIVRYTTNAISAVSICCLHLLRYRDDCPPNHACIPNHPRANLSPYSEFTEVTQTSQVYRVTKKLADVTSAYQHIEVFDSYFFGKILVIDGALMITERDECIYHEMITHVPLAYLPHVRACLHAALVLIAA